jgi:methylmalonyl-CoA/ethylmalonyl-CoA epimerase
MKKVEHIGIAVKSIEASNDLFAALLGTEPYKREVVESESVITSFFKTGETKIELLESSRPEGAIAKFIEKRGEGIHHIAFEVEDIGKAVTELKQRGFVFLSEEPKKGADNKLICFIHPKSANGILVELCQEIKTPQ